MKAAIVVVLGLLVPLVSGVPGLATSRQDLCPDGSTPVVCVRSPCPRCPDTCRLPKVVGPCEALIDRYFFNSETGKCELFKFGGCGGNANNFMSFEACRKICGGPAEDPCKLPLKIGPCRARIPRFYFDSAAGKCKQFFWGGCQPNANNFETLADCRRTCPGRPDLTNFCLPENTTCGSWFGCCKGLTCCRPVENNGFGICQKVCTVKG